MATKAQLVSDIILRLTKGKPSDDLELEPAQVAFWIGEVAEELLIDYLMDRAKRRLPIDDSILLKESSKPLYMEQVNYINSDIKDMYITLRHPPLASSGIDTITRVRTSDGMVVNKTTIHNIDLIREMEFSSPSTSNLVYYKDTGSRIVIDGIPSAMVDMIEIVVWYVPKQDVECLLDSDEVIVPAGMVPELLDIVEEIAKRQMYGSAEDLENDGQQDLQEVR